MNNIELVIFDCDGVVIDSEILSASVLIDMLAHLGIDIDPNYVQRHYLGCSFETVKQNIKDNFSKQLPQDFESRYRQTLVNEFETKLQTTDGIQDVLRQLSVPFCIATSSSPSRTEKALKSVQLHSSFSPNIFTREEVLNGKPAPDLFLHAAHKMGVTPENCLVIEDSKAGVQAAISAGMQVLHYSGGQHLQNNINHVHTHYPDVAVLAHWQLFFSAFPSLKNQATPNEY
ncbi:HAD family hydrolase [uncultured Psychrosphaera sp.]|uniref:HAD family hydrolase n=1 Tax=uncultured Psychrosphaera sp. TaxID=1403522 RepID=UPI0030FAC233